MNIFDELDEIMQDNVYAYGLVYTFLSGGNVLDMPTNESELYKFLMSALSEIDLKMAFNAFSTHDFNNQTLYELLEMNDLSTILTALSDEMLKVVVYPLYSHDLELFKRLSNNSHNVLRYLLIDEYIVEKAWIKRFRCVKSSVNTYADTVNCTVIDSVLSECIDDKLCKDGDIVLSKCVDAHAILHDSDKAHAIRTMQGLLINGINHDQINARSNNVFDKRWVMSMITTMLLHGSQFIPNFDPTAYVPIAFQTDPYNELFEIIIELHKKYVRKAPHDARLINCYKQISKDDVAKCPEFIRIVLIEYMLTNGWKELETCYSLDILDAIHTYYYEGKRHEIYEMLVKSNVSLLLEGIPDPRCNELLTSDLSKVYVKSTLCTCRFKFTNVAVCDYLQ